VVGFQAPVNACNVLTSKGTGSMLPYHSLSRRMGLTSRLTLYFDMECIFKDSMHVPSKAGLLGPRYLGAVREVIVWVV
jgi:hypothetical protein